MFRLSIIIVSYNARPELEKCLESLVQHPPKIEHEIVVVDNASTEGNADLVRQRWPKIRLIETGSNLGFSRANNIGIRNTSSELILLLNGDTIVNNRAIDTLSNKLNTRSDVAVIGPKLVNGEGDIELSFGPMISPLGEAWQKLLVRGNDYQIEPIRSYVKKITQKEHEVDWVSGACLLVRRHDAEAVGLLDERYFMYAEDVDFCAAIRANGKKILFTPTTKIVHLRGRSASTNPKLTKTNYHRSKLAFYKKYHPQWAQILRIYLRLRGYHFDTDI
jgi:GT2 family glycosyltransferase